MDPDTTAPSGGAPAPDLVPRPAAGRVFTGRSRPVRFSDVDPSGRLRLDGIARYLQDVSADDTLDAALPDASWWVVRRTVIEVAAFPRYLEPLTPTTWCSGTASHFAERRAQLVGPHGRVEAASLWVSIDRASGRPARLSPAFLDRYAEAAGGRRVRARLAHGDPPAELEPRRWVLRATDFDPWRHVNNSVYWAIVEEAIAGEPSVGAPLRAELEHRSAIERGADVTWVCARREGAWSVWVLADGAVAASAVVVVR